MAEGGGEGLFAYVCVLVDDTLFILHALVCRLYCRERVRHKEEEERWKELFACEKEQPRGCRQGGGGGRTNGNRKERGCMQQFV